MEKKFGRYQRFFLTNKVKEISFKLIHKFYPVKQYLSKFKNDIDVNCSFCQKHPETCTHLFWSCEFTYKFWRDFHKFIADSVFSDFHLYYKNVIFGFHNFNHKDSDAFFFINVFLFLANFHIHKCKFINRKPELWTIYEDNLFIEKHKGFKDYQHLQIAKFGYMKYALAHLITFLLILCFYFYLFIFSLYFTFPSLVFNGVFFQSSVFCSWFCSV